MVTPRFPTFVLTTPDSLHLPKWIRAIEVVSL